MKNPLNVGAYLDKGGGARFSLFIAANVNIFSVWPYFFALDGKKTGTFKKLISMSVWNLVQLD